MNRICHNDNGAQRVDKLIFDPNEKFATVLGMEALDRMVPGPSGFKKAVRWYVFRPSAKAFQRMGHHALAYMQSARLAAERANEEAKKFTSEMLEYTEAQSAKDEADDAWKHASAKVRHLGQAQAVRCFDRTKHVTEALEDHEDALPIRNAASYYGEALVKRESSPVLSPVPPPRGLLASPRTGHQCILRSR